MPINLICMYGYVGAVSSNVSLMTCLLRYLGKLVGRQTILAGDFNCSYSKEYHLQVNLQLRELMVQWNWQDAAAPNQLRNDTCVTVQGSSRPDMILMSENGARIKEYVAKQYDWLYPHKVISLEVTTTRLEPFRYLISSPSVGAEWPSQLKWNTQEGLCWQVIPLPRQSQRLPAVPWELCC